MLDLEHCPVVITSTDGMHYYPVGMMKTGPRRTGCCSSWPKLKALGRGIFMVVAV